MINETVHYEDHIRGQQRSGNWLGIIILVAGLYLLLEDLSSIVSISTTTIVLLLLGLVLVTRPRRGPWGLRSRPTEDNQG